MNFYQPYNVHANKSLGCNKLLSSPKWKKPLLTNRIYLIYLFCKVKKKKNYIYIYIYIHRFKLHRNIILRSVILINIFLICVNFDKFIVRFHYLFSVLAKFQNDQISIVISSINCLNLKFL